MTADLFTLGLEVKSDGVATASDRLNNLAAAGKTAEDGTSKLSAAFDKLGYSLSNLQDLMMKAASAFALMKLAEVAKEATLLAARYETLGVVMTVIGKNAGYTQSQMTGFQAALQKTGISAVEARQGLALMGQAQIDFANSAKLARIAQDAAVIGNINSSEAFNRMLTGLAIGQSIMLHHLGLMTNFEQAYINAAHAAGKTTKDLSETEKAQIRVNEVVRAGVGIAGAYEAAMGTVGKQISSLPRYINDLMVQIGAMGQGALFTAVSGLTDGLKWLSKNLDEVISTAQGLAAAFGIVQLTKYAEGLAMTSMHGQALRMMNIDLATSTAATSVANEYSAISTLSAARATEMKTAVNLNAANAELRNVLAMEISGEVQAAQIGFIATKTQAQVVQTLASEAATVSEVELTAAETELSLATARAAEAAAALSIAQTEISVTSRLAAGATSAFSGALALVGGVYGLIAIAIGTVIYGIYKLTGGYEEHQKKLKEFEANLPFAKTLEALKEQKELIAKLKEQVKLTAAETEADNIRRENQKLINEAVKENIELQKKLNKERNNVFNWSAFGGVSKADEYEAQIAANEARIAAGKQTAEAKIKQNAEQKRLQDAMKAKEPAKPTTPPTMQDDDEYSRSLKKSAEEYEKYKDEVRKRSESADKNAMDIRLDQDKTLKDQLLLGERAYAELVLREHAAQAQTIANLEYKKYEEAKTRLAAVQAALAGKTLPDGTVAEGKIGNEIVGQAELNKARAKVEETARIVEAADTKATIDKNELDNLGAKYAAIDKLALKELEIQKLEVNGATEEAQRQRDDLKYEKMWLDTHNMVLIVRNKELDLIIRTKQQEDARRNAANTVQDLNTATKDIGISMIDDPAARKAAEIQAGYDKTLVNIQREKEAIAEGRDIQIQAITDLEERRQAGFDKQIALNNKLAAAELKTKKDLAANGKEDTATRWDTMLASAKKVTPQLSALDGLLAIQHKTYEKDATDATQMSTNGKLAMTADYVGAAGSMFTGLASTMDTSSRSGFESAKAFNIAAAVMDTAAAIIKCYSLGPIAGTVAAVGVAALGAIQIAKIASTSYKGGASAPSVMAVGSFGGSAGGSGSGSTIGSSIGNAYTSIHDSQTYDSLKKMADSADNASVAIGKVADGMTKISDMFATGTIAGNIATQTSGYGSSVVDSKVTGQTTNFMKTLFTGGLSSLMGSTSSDAVAMGAGIGAILGPIGSAIGAAVGAVVEAIGNGPWIKEFGGIAMTMAGGTIGGQKWGQYGSEGGLFSGNRNKITAEGAVDPVFVDALTDQMNKLKATIATAAVAMGTTVDFAQAAAVGMNIITTGKSTADLNKEFEAFFTQIAGSLAQTMAGLKEFTYYGESAFDAVVRLSTALQSVNTTFQLIGATLIESTLSGANVAYKLQDLMGGADKFASKMDKYFTAIFTSAEQSARKATQALTDYTKAFAAMNAAYEGDATVEIPATRAAFASLMSYFTAQLGDTTTIYTAANGKLVTGSERAAAFIAALVDVSEGFSTVAIAAEKLRDDLALSTQDLKVRLLRIDGLTAEADMVALIGTQEAELTDYYQKGLDTGKLRIVQEKEYQAALKESIKSLGAVMTNLDGFISGQLSVLNAVKSIKTSDPSLTPLQKLTTAQQTYEDWKTKATVMIAPLAAGATAEQTSAYNLAVKNRNTALTNLGGAGQDYITTASNYYGSSMKYQEILQQVTGQLATIGGMDSTDPTITALNSQITWLDSIHTAITDGDEKALKLLVSGSNANFDTNGLLTSYLQAVQDLITNSQTEQQKQDALTTANSALPTAQAKANQSLAALTLSETKGTNAQALVSKLSGPATMVGSLLYLADQVTTLGQARDSFSNYAGQLGATVEGMANSNLAIQTQVKINDINDTITQGKNDLIQAQLDVANTGAAHAGLYTTSQTDAREVIRLGNLIKLLLSAVDLVGPVQPSYAVGSAYIPNDMTANIHQAEMIIDRQSADVLRKYGIQVNGAADNREVVAELKESNLKLEAVERRLANIEVKARLVANS